MKRFDQIPCLGALLLLLILASAILAAPAQAVTPAAAWRLLAVSGPTNLPPTTSEIQTVSVDATGGTFALSFAAQTTPALAFDATAAEVRAALEGLAGIGGAGGSVEVSGGPGDAGATEPYFVRFGGDLAGLDVPQMTADSTQLTGAGATATVDTQTAGGTAGTGTLMIYATNVGDAATAGPVTLNIGPLPSGITTAATPTGAGWSCTPAGAGQSTISCTRTLSIPSGVTGATVAVPVVVGPLAAVNSIVPLSIEGGGAAPDPEHHDEYTLFLEVSNEPAPPGIQALWAGAFEGAGVSARKAGGHPLRASTGFLMATKLAPTGKLLPSGELRDVEVELPPGFVGNPTVTARCPQSALTEKESPVCPASAVVGRAQPALEGFAGGTGFEQSSSVGLPIFNDEPSHGYPAQFTFPFALAQAVTVASLRSDEDYGVTISAPNIPPIYKTYGAFVTLEGNPAGAGGKAFLTNATNCAEQAASVPLTTFRTNTWLHPSIFDQNAVEIPPVTECDQLDFEPDFSFQPSGGDAASATGAEVSLSVPQDGLLDPAKLASPHLKTSVVRLPQGLTLNPSAADGLQACSTQQIGLKGTGFPAPNPIRFDMSHPSCPEASKVGTAELETPLLDENLEGTVYLAAQGDNPFHSLLALYLVIDDAEIGILAKLPGEIQTNPATGQVTAVFDNNPQLPFSNLKLRFRGGTGIPRSTLATPDVCGDYATHSDFTPWSAPESGPPAQVDNSFTIARGVGGSPACPRSKAERPFALGFEAGSSNALAGAHSPFTLRITRPDGNQELDRVTVTTPPGFAATLKGVGVCSEAQVAAAQAPGRTGKEEIAAPSCPASSQIGTTTIGAGAGPAPLYVKTGKVYLSGPYKGAPVSFTFVVPAVAGPFDLGVQVVRTAVKLDPKTAQATAISDPIPTILKGIPVLIRDIQVNLDRSGFTLNPTSCEPMTVTGQVSGSSGAVANLTNRFQVGECGKLKFQPKLQLQLHGGTERGAYQRLTATYTAKPGEANTGRVAVTLPHSEFLAQEHIRTVCTRVQFAAHTCPRGSIYGQATATTPLLDEPLTGPVYLRSSDNPLPDLVAALRGPDSRPIEVELVGRTDSKNGGIRNTFDVVPDAPVSRFTLQLQGGSKSLIVNSRDLCEGPRQRATVRLLGQNGARHDFRPVVGNDCKKKRLRGKGKEGNRVTPRLPSLPW